MTEVLSQEEIDQLLNAITSGETSIETVTQTATQKKIRIYDFKRPSRFSKDQTRAIEMIYEAFARLSQTTLSAILRSQVQLHVASVDELTYEEFTRSIPNPTTLAIINMDPLKGSAIFEIDPAITFAIIERIFGGKGLTMTKITRELTDIESAVMESIVVKLLSNLREAWANFVDLRPRLGSIETNPQFATIVAPAHMTILVTLETKIGEIEGMSNFCLPHLTLEPIMSKLTPQIWYSTIGKGKYSEYLNTIKKNIEDVRLELKAILARSYIPFREVLELKVGDIIQFPGKKISDDLEVQVVNKIKFYGKPGIYEKNMAVQITKVVEVPELEEELLKEQEEYNE